MIYGGNGVGKSNFGDALKFLHAIGSGRSIRDAIEGHYAASFSGSPTEVSAGIRGGGEATTHLEAKSKVFHVEVEGLTPKGRRLHYRLSVDARQYRIVAESLSAEDHPGAYVYDTHPESAPLRQSDSPAIKARYYTNARGKNPSRSFSPHETILSQFSGRKAEYVYNEARAQEMRDLLTSIQPLELRPEILRNYSTLGRFNIGEHGENLAAAAWLLLSYASGYDPTRASDAADVETDAYERLQAIKSWLSEMTPRPVTDLLVEEAPTGEVILALKEEPFSRPLTARSLSDGTLRFTGFAFALLGSAAPRTYVIEELENGINPSRLALMIRMISAATRNGPVQVLTTTHSPTLLDIAGKELLHDMLFVGWDSDNNCSVVNKVSQLTPQYLAEDHRLGELLTEGYLQLAADR
ncbi:ATP-binding protein [Micromonospora sp. MED01]|nr:ATP-binding protein [Micromonospora alfalfae]